MEGSKDKQITRQHIFVVKVVKIKRLFIQKAALVKILPAAKAVHWRRAAVPALLVKSDLFHQRIHCCWRQDQFQSLLQDLVVPLRYPRSYLIRLKKTQLCNSIISKIQAEDFKYFRSSERERERERERGFKIVESRI